MASGYKTQLTRQIGEHLAVSKLGRFGIIATPFAGNLPDYDILAADLKGNTLPIQVKAINGPSWQFKITSFLEIQFENDGSQKIIGKVELPNPNLICIFILLKNDQEDDFFIFHIKELQEYFYKTYKGGLRPRNPKSLHCAVWPKDLIKYKDDWKLILKKLNAID